MDDWDARHSRRAHAGRKDDGRKDKDSGGGLRCAVRYAAGWRAEAVLSVQGGPADLQRGTESAGGCDDPMGERQLRICETCWSPPSVNSSTPNSPNQTLFPSGNLLASLILGAASRLHTPLHHAAGLHVVRACCEVLGERRSRRLDGQCGRCVPGGDPARCLREVCRRPRELEGKD